MHPNLGPITVTGSVQVHMHIWSYLTIPALSTYAAFKLGSTDPGPGTIVVPWIISHASWLVSTNHICFDLVFSPNRFSIGRHREWPILNFSFVWHQEKHKGTGCCY
ncbi:hypothetical protein BDR06DRAFT_959641 [Suillus hirtellus]|nr:hypothetical protein BDR06DRAFT_959641 [Suillus hirtellus]